MRRTQKVTEGNNLGRLRARHRTVQSEKRLEQCEYNDFDQVIPDISPKNRIVSKICTDSVFYRSIEKLSSEVRPCFPLRWINRLIPDAIPKLHTFNDILHMMTQYIVLLSSKYGRNAKEPLSV